MGLSSPSVRGGTMMLAKLTDKITWIRIAKGNRYFLDGLFSLQQQGPRFTHPSFHNPLFNGTSRLSLHQVGKIGRRVTGDGCHIC